ncbi:MAG: thioredoxin family protein [Bacteroidales bacterium]|jgi:thiol:disulfide interchange protein DsbD|nr:thioredoxin family protein [Bacteroidales bacterium]MDD3300527.1 thioredoxin family protein [Bacteroidales bacterium]MDD4619192.1 thioredoxin family protein [Bacteroidales bacterium]
MKKQFLLLSLFVISLFCFSPLTAQRVEQPIRWKYEIGKSTDNQFIIKLTGDLDPNRPEWHIYGLGPYENGPTPTSLVVEAANGNASAFELVGGPYLLTEEYRKYDEMFGMEIGICEDKVVIAQKVRVLSADSVALLAIVEWQACDDQSCLPPTDKEFAIKLPGVGKAAAGSDATKSAKAEATIAKAETTPSVKPETTSATKQAAKTANVAESRTASSSTESATGESATNESTTGQSTTNEPITNGSDSIISNTVLETDNQESTTGSLSPVSAGTSDDKSMWGVIIEAIIWGFVALLTPCVFPMVPMTVSFFLKQSQQSQEREDAAGEVIAGGKEVRSSSSRGRIMASFFGLSIIALYTLPIAAIIVITYFAGGEAVTADIFNWLATHWVPNLLFFIIFMVFAASFFGAFEIVLPSWLVNKSDSKSDKGGYAGVFFMALTLVLVSFSCTGPIVGTILIKSTQGEIWEPIITMLAFSAAFALPFTIFAFAPSLLKDLPKSGGWLNSVKVVLGFIEVALGFKFLSVADQVYHWGLLDREVYLAIWIVVFTLMGLYLLGKLRFAHDSPQEYITVKRLAMSIVTFAFVVYMIPGMWGAPLKALSGYLPPMGSQDFRTAQVGGVGGYGAGTYDTGAAGTSGEGSQGFVQGANSANHSLRAQGIVPTYSDFLHLPHGLEGFFRYQEGMEYAKKVGKPVFIDFTGHGCVNCREMEARVWSDPRVLKLLREEFVLIALYADDKKTAVEGDWITSESGRVLKSIGKINAHLAMNKYNVNAQPYYAIIDPATEEHLTDPMGYNLDVEVFLEFLRNGMAR